MILLSNVKALQDDVTTAEYISISIEYILSTVGGTVITGDVRY